MQNYSYGLCKTHLQWKMYIICLLNTSCKRSTWMLGHIWMHWRFHKEVQMSFEVKPTRCFHKCMQSCHFIFMERKCWLQYVINETTTVKYVYSYMTKGEKGMGETLKRVAKECWNDAIWTQMNKIKKKFLDKQVLGAPESAVWVLSMWLMKKSRKVVSVSTGMKDEHVSLPKPK